MSHHAAGMSELTDIVNQHYEGINTGDLDLAMKCLASNVATLTPDGASTGLASFRELAQAFLTAAPDGKIIVKRIIESDDTVVVEGEYSGTHTGPLASPDGVVAATGRSFSFVFADIFTVSNGKVVTHNVYWDNMSFMGQLGLLN